MQAYSPDGSVHFYGFEDPVKYSLKVHKTERGSASVGSHNLSLPPAVSME